MKQNFLNIIEYFLSQLNNKPISFLQTQKIKTKNIEYREKHESK